MIGEICDGKFRVIRLLGQGGMGSVYEAEQIETGQRVALKCIEEGILVRGRSSVSRFQREARAMGSIETEHIARVLDAGMDPATRAPYMAMELLEGEDLQQLLDRVGVLEPESALRIAAQVCLGLQKAHEARVVHRDIKPANLFLARRGDGEIVVKILDFGIAKIKPDPAQAGPTTGLTRTGGVLGSPLYMSPEQARGLKEIDHHTDIWSLGMVLYRALSGMLPNEHIEAFGDLIMAICSQSPRPIQEHAPWVSREVAAVAHGALRLGAGDRFPTASAMFDAILPLLPDGWSLREQHLVPLSEETRASAAALLPLAHAGDGAHRRLVHIVAQGGVIHGSETTLEAPGDTRTTAGIGNETTADAGVTTATGDREVTRRASGAPRPRTHRRWKAPATALLLLVVGGVVALNLSGASRSKESPGAASPSASRVVVDAPPPAPPASEVPSAAQKPAFASGKLVVFPADVSVDIDGKPAKVEGGEVKIEGALGSRHQVRLYKGKEEQRGEVILNETGALPATMQLDTAKRRPTAPPGAKSTGAPTSTAGPSPPKATSTAESLIPETFK